MRKFGKYLKPGEELWQVYKRHGLTYFLWWIAGFILVLAAFFFLWPLFRMGGWGVIIFLVLLFVGAGIIIRTIRLWNGNLLLLTSQRVIDISRSGFFGETISEMPFYDIQDVSWARKGFWATIWRYGTVQLVSVGGAVRLLFPNLIKPTDVATQIVGLKDRARGLVNEPKVNSSTTIKERTQIISEVFKPKR
jgi:hypothetical protein